MHSGCSARDGAADASGPEPGGRQATRRNKTRACCGSLGRLQPARGRGEDRILARLRALRSDLIDPTISVHHGRVVKRTGDGSLIEFRSVVDAVRCAIEVGREAGLRELVAEVLLGNLPMLRVFERSGLDVKTRRDGTVAHVTLRYP